MMKRTLSTLCAATTVLCMTMQVMPVYADVVVPTENPRIEAKRCTTAKGRIANTADTIKTVSERRATAYGNIRERSLARITVLKQKGYNTAALEANLQIIQEQTKDYQTKKDSLLSALATAQNTACDDDESAFNAALGNARTQLKATREASQAIHQTFRDKVVPDIQAAAQWVKDR